MITEALKKYPQFILCNENKIPLNPHTLEVADAHDSSIWVTAEQVAALSALTGYRIGFVITEPDPFFFADLDNCRNPDGTLTPVAQQIVQAFPGCYIEVSMSGTGLHIIGTIPADIPHSCKNTALDIELYTSGRYVALTGTSASGDANCDPGANYQWLVDNYFPVSAAGPSQSWTDVPDPGWSGPTDDQELISRMLQSRSAANTWGDGVPITDLWENNIPVLAARWPSSDPKKTHDASSADASLMLRLAWWCGKDCSRMQRIFEMSGLVRDKWQNRQDYRQRTILNAVAKCRDVYTAGAPAAIPITTQPPVEIALNIPDNLLNPGGLISLGIQACIEESGVNIPQYSLPDVLSLIAASVKGCVKYDRGYPSLFLIKIGPTSTGKTESGDALRQAISSRAFVTEGLFGPTDLASGPALFRAVSVTPQCLIAVDEVGYLFKSYGNADANAAGLRQAFLELSTAAGRTIHKAYAQKNADIIIKNPCVNFVGNATPTAFSDFTNDDMETGLIQRFVFFCYEDVVPYRTVATGGQAAAQFADYILAINQQATGTSVHDLSGDPEVAQILTDYSRQVIDEQNKTTHPGVAGIIARKYNLAVTLAIVHAISRMTTDIFTGSVQVVDIQYGIALATVLTDWKVKVLPGKIGQGDFAAKCELMLDAVRACEKKGRKPTKGLMCERRPRLKNLKPTEWREIMETLRIWQETE